MTLHAKLELYLATTPSCSKELLRTASVLEAIAISAPGRMHAPRLLSGEAKFLCGHDSVDELKPSVGDTDPASVWQKSKWNNHRLFRALDKNLGVMLLVGVS